MGIDRVNYNRGVWFGSKYIQFGPNLNHIGPKYDIPTLALEKLSY